MSNAAQITFIVGLIMLSLTILNASTGEAVTPNLQRAEILGVVSSISLMLVGIIWSDVNSRKPTKVQLVGDNGLVMDDALDESIKRELGWGTQIILTSTSAATILVYWKNKTLIKRGLLQDSVFIPGEITKRVLSSGKMISLVNTKLFPGRVEFDSLLKNLPSILIVPMNNEGIIVVGGWTERCFTKSNEVLIQGWALKVVEELDNISSKTTG